MKIRRLIFLRLFFLLCVLVLIGQQTYQWQKRSHFRGAGKNVQLNNDELSQLVPIAKSISSASLTLLEGLPHPKVEPAEYQRELASEKSILLHGHEFYKTPLLLQPEDIEPLRKLCADKTSYWRWGGSKLCGGYHPDYCLVWKNGAVHHYLLICLGCYEIKLVGSNLSLHFDLRDEASTGFGKLLLKYHSQRPYGRMLSEIRIIHGYKDEHPAPQSPASTP